MLVQLKERLGEWQPGEQLDVASDLARQLVGDGRAQLVDVPADEPTAAPTLVEVKKFAAANGIRNLRTAAQQMAAQAAEETHTTASSPGDHEQGGRRER